MGLGREDMKVSISSSRPSRPKAAPGARPAWPIDSRRPKRTDREGSTIRTIARGQRPKSRCRGVVGRVAEVDQDEHEVADVHHPVLIDVRVQHRGRLPSAQHGDDVPPVDLEVEVRVTGIAVQQQMVPAARAIDRIAIDVLVSRRRRVAAEVLVGQVRTAAGGVVHPAAAVDVVAILNHEVLEDHPRRR
jgi:hypothetical protein